MAIRLTGTLHPITQYLRRSISVFKDMGFEVLDSPEIVTEKNNFDDLLIPEDHPARGMQDTFWLTDPSSANGFGGARGRKLPRTHTSAYQIPAMKDHTPPVKFLIPGRVFRNEATDATHEIMFYQLEGFAIDKDISLANLKYVLLKLLKTLYGADVSVKFLPSYFPFVEPGLEIHAKIGSKWIEMGGAGMIHPGVIKNMGLDPDKYQGFAFGMGIDRLVMMLYGIEDIRYLYSGNLRFLKQFKNQ